MCDFWDQFFVKKRQNLKNGNVGVDPGGKSDSFAKMGWEIPGLTKRVRNF